MGSSGINKMHKRLRDIAPDRVHDIYVLDNPAEFSREAQREAAKRVIFRVDMAPSEYAKAKELL